MNHEVDRESYGWSHKVAVVVGTRCPAIASMTSWTYEGDFFCGRWLCRGYWSKSWAQHGRQPQHWRHKTIGLWRRFSTQPLPLSLATPLPLPDSWHYKAWFKVRDQGSRTWVRDGLRTAENGPRFETRVLGLMALQTVVLCSRRLPV